MENNFRVHDDYGIYVNVNSRELAVYEWSETLAWPVFRLYHAPFSRMDFDRKLWRLVAKEGDPLPDVIPEPDGAPKSPKHALRNERDRARRNRS